MKIKKHKKNEKKKRRKLKGENYKTTKNIWTNTRITHNLKNNPKKFGD